MQKIYKKVITFIIKIFEIHLENKYLHYDTKNNSNKNEQTSF